MATLTINGRKVKVDDSFLSLTKEQQDATVDEIAASFGQQPGLPSGAQLQGRVADLPSQQPAPTPRPDLLSSTLATVNGLSASVPFLQGTTDTIGGLIAQATGGNSNEYIARQRAIREGLAKQAPLARLSGEIGGTVAGMGALGATKAGAEALGMTGPLWQRIANSGLSSAGLSTADALSRGERGTDALSAGALGGTLGAVLPIAGAGLRLGGSQVKKSLIDPIATMLAPENAVTSNLGKSIGADKAAGAIMSSADEATARAAGVPITNADRFGPAVRRLTRTASNIDDEAKATLSRAVDDRFAGQTTRAENFVRQLMGGATDDLALKDTLRAAADASNSINYSKAMNDPNARAVWSQPIAELMQSPTFRAAIDAAESRGADRAAVSGFKAVKNPFVQTPDGGFTLRTNPDGSRALPSLQFWDQVKRNLDGLIDQARPTPIGGGDRTKYADLTALKRKLVSALDAQVPSYANARSKAAAFFGAEDAIDVGRKALTMTKQLPELERAVAGLTKAEKDAASVGYASELIDSIRASGDNRNIAIASFFNNPEARARTALFLGPTKAKQLEAYIRVESIVDQLRGAVKGNSSTAEQLIAAGAVGTGVGVATGDWQSGMTVGVLAGLGMKGLKAAGKNVDEQVMRRVAEILLSDDPRLLERAIQNASLSKAHMEALDGILRGLSIGARGAVLATAN
jgi:hypothetical protein